MKLHNFNVLSFLIFVLSIVSVSAQTTDKLWQKKLPSQINTSNKLERKNVPSVYNIFNLDLNLLKSELQKSPKRSGKSRKSSNIISFPNAAGEIEQYEVFEASILAEELQEKYPNIKSYVGKSVENPSNTIRFSVSKLGLHAMIFDSSNGTVYIDPYTSNKQSYIIYSKKDLPAAERFECYVEESSTASKDASSNLLSKSNDAGDGLLRTYRLAIATTGEYSQFQLIYNGIAESASDAEKKEVVLAAINATMTRVNGIYERDVALTMVLVANNTEVIYLNPASDPFTNDDSNLLIQESQTVIDNKIGFNNYDIGHTFSTGGGGLATLNSPCTTSKAKGITGSSYPIGDAYDIDFVAHEMGHQYGAHHTFNGDTGSCDGNRNANTAVEPGSGSTIMAYAGLCAPENVQSQSGDYFHLVSIQEMWANITLGNSSSCAQTSDTGNTSPIVSPLATYTIPRSTPFVLNAEATDSSSDVLTYTWEQLDNEIAVAPPVSTSTEGPSYRSVGPSESSMRYFPDQETVISGVASSTWEVTPSVSRTMKFGVNVRDNNINGGQSTSQETIITFDGASGPFKMTSQDSFDQWNSGSTETITWNVGNTDVAPVNCINVNILLSLDGGYTFPVTLASNIPNNGSATITVPNVSTNIGRVKVESANNIFYDISDENVTVIAKEFAIDFTDTNAEVCGTDNINYNFTYKTYLGFDEATTFSATGNPVGTTVSFDPTTATTNDTAVQMTVSGLAAVAVGSYEIIVTGTSAVSSMVKEIPVTLKVYNNTLVVPTLVEPSDNAEGVLIPYVLNWNSDENSSFYTVEISTENSFNSIIEQATVDNNSYSPELLAVNTSYFWRVKALNDCGESGYSSIFKFTTANETCDTYASTDTPKTIPDDDETGVNSVITVTDNKLITDVAVKVNISHTYVSDLSLSLISPKGVIILLSLTNGGSGSNYVNTIFDDDASEEITNASPPFTGTFKPQIPLSFLDGTLSYGDWTLKVTDSGAQDIGSITNWSLEICGVPTAITDDDQDGVENDIDQCPNTPLGTTVNELGCFALPATNFSIEAVGETCPDEDNGQILINAEESHNYTLVFEGTSSAFLKSKAVTDLAPGTYEFCILIESEMYEQCFEIVVEESEEIGGKATVKDNEIAIDITQGTGPFSATINGVKVLETSNNSFVLNVEHGDLVEVKSAKECEGVFEKQIDLFDTITAFPNPTDGVFEIGIPDVEKEVVVEIYNMQSQLISTNKYAVNYGKIRLSIADKPTGIYMVKLLLENNPVVIKIVKK